MFKRFRSWRRERDLNPWCSYGSTHDFESCAFDHSAISALHLVILLYYSNFVNLSGRYFINKVDKTPITMPANTLNAHTNGSWI